MINEKVFLDANILLDLLLDREKSTAAKEYIIKNDGKLYISALTAHFVMHFGLKLFEQSVLRKYLNDFYIEDLTAQDVEWAFNNARNNDFEDALQLAVAIHSGCDTFATLDAVLYKNYKSLPTIALQHIK